MSYKFGKKKKTNFWYAIIVFLVVVFGIVFSRQIARLFDKPGNSISEPLWQVSQFMQDEIKEGFLQLQSKKTLVRNLLKLQDELVLLKESASQNEILTKENEELKRALGLFRESEYVATAHILRRPPQVAYDTIVIDLGENDGLSRGDLVFVDSRIYLGVVSEVHSKTSLVTLFSTSSVETEAVFLDAGFAITLTGVGGGSFEGYVPKGADVSEEDVLVSVENNSWQVADIVRVGGDAQDPSKKIIAKNPVNLRHVNTVFVKRF